MKNFTTQKQRDDPIKHAQCSSMNISPKDRHQRPISTGKDAQHHESPGKRKSKPQRDPASHPTGWLRSKGKCREDVEERGSRVAPVGASEGAAAGGHSLARPQNVRQRTTDVPARTLLGMDPRETGTRPHKHPEVNVHGAVTPSKQRSGNNPDAVSRRVNECGLCHQWNGIGDGQQ